ncbi:MAG: HpsJ family protein [Cyanobacteria bacterium P01_A01_bin.17]
MIPKKKSGSNPFQQKRLPNNSRELQQFYFSVFRAASLFHWVGYGLLLFVGLDLVAIFYPSYFTDPAWEFQTIGQLVERVPVPLLGLLLVFFGERKPRARWEFPILKILSWITLLAGLIFLLAIPLGITDTLRLDQMTQERVNISTEQQQARVQQVEEQVQQATTSSQLVAIAQRYSVEELDLPSSETENDVEPLRDQFSDALAQRQRVLESNRLIQLTRQRNRLLKQSVKWHIGALIAAILLIGLWKGSRWAR